MSIQLLIAYIIKNVFNPKNPYNSGKKKKIERISNKIPDRKTNSP